MEQAHVSSLDVAGGHVPLDTHLSIHDVASFVDGTLSARQLADVEEHLAICAQCRSEMTAVSSLVASAPVAQTRTRRALMPGVAVLAAAAAFVFLVATPRHDGVRGRAAVTERRAPATGSASSTIETLTPGAASIVSRDSLRFAWRRDEASTYRLFITDSAGAQVYSTDTGDTTMIPPRSLAITPGVRYFWYVDALRADGASASSTPSEFSIRP